MRFSLIAALLLSITASTAQADNLFFPIYKVPLVVICCSFWSEELSVPQGC